MIDDLQFLDALQAREWNANYDDMQTRLFEMVSVTNKDLDTVSDCMVTKEIR